MYHIGDWVVRSSGAGKEDNSGISIWQNLACTQS